MSRGLQGGVSRGRLLADPRDEPCGTQWAGGWALGRREGASGREEGEGGGRRTPPPRLSAGLRTGARGWPRRASAPLTGTLPFKAGARAHPAPPFGGARGGRRSGSRELTCRRGAKESGARGRAGGGRRRGRALGAAGLRRRLLWRSRPEPPPSSPLLSSCSPAAAGLGPGGSRVSPGPGGGAGCRGPGEASHPPWGSGAPPPQPRNMAGRGARRAGVAGVSLGDPRALPGGARPGRSRGSRFQLPQLPPLTAQASPRCGGPRLLPFSTSV